MVILLVPVLFGLAAWYLTNILADTLPFTPSTSPHCPNRACRASLSWADALLLRRCPSCGRMRGTRTWFLLIVYMAASIYMWYLPPAGLGYFAAILVFTYLVCIAIIDLEHRLILRPLSVVGVALAAGTGLLMNGWLNTLIGALVGFFVLLIFYMFGKLFTRWRARRLGQPADGEEALGSGDVTLALILGLMLGWPLIWFDILFGVLLAGLVSLIIILFLVISGRYHREALMIFIPIGPGFILVAIMILFLPQVMAVLVPQ